MKAFNRDCEIFANLRIAFVSSSNHHRSPQKHPLYAHFAADEDREEGAGQDSVRGPDEAHLLRPVRGGGGEPQHCLYSLRVTGIRTAERPHHRPRH